MVSIVNKSHILFFLSFIMQLSLLILLSLEIFLIDNSKKGKIIQNNSGIIVKICNHYNYPTLKDLNTKNKPPIRITIAAP